MFLTKAGDQSGEFVKWILGFQGLKKDVKNKKRKLALYMYM